MQISDKKICIYDKKVVSLHPNYGNQNYETAKNGLLEGQKIGTQTCEVIHTLLPVR